jgi:hypothetical protein
MSLLRWFTRGKPEAEAPSLPLNDSTRPSPLGARKVERGARREQLYAVVRDCMQRAGVLSASYRFKVLSLDGRGRQFMVMVDLVGAPAANAAGLASIEETITKSAKARHEIVVKGVYWRQEKSIAVPATVARSAAAATPAASRQKAEPLEAAEIAAFQKALAAGIAAKPEPIVAAAQAPSHKTPTSYTLLTGFEDTEQAAGAGAAALSATQYGELR